MAISTFVFWLIALMTTVSALVVVSAKNILHAAFALCTAFLGVGALYVFLHADFVAAVQLIVYVGGILVLIMFAVMFSSNVAEDTSAERRGWFSITTGALVAIGVFGGIFLTIHRLQVPLRERNQFANVDYANTVGVQSDIQTKADLDLISKFETPLNTAGKDAVVRLSNADLKSLIDKFAAAEDRENLKAAYDRGRSRYGIGHKLIAEYILPFEVVSILLLAALVGAVVIVRKELNSFSK